MFIPLAEYSEQIIPMTNYLIKNILTDFKDFLSRNRDFHVSINITVTVLMKGDFLDQLEALVKKYNIHRDQIWLELTEQAMMNEDKAKPILNHIRHLGYIIVIDDFGTGYSNLSYLQRFPVDIIKIDKSFIATLETSSVTSDVTLHIIEIAKLLNLEIVAEGIENATQEAYLRSHNVEYGQGWYYKQAVSLEAFFDFVHNTNKKERIS